MTDLFDIKNIKGKIFFTILGVVLVLVLFIFGYMMPMRTKIAKAEEDLQNLERQRVDAARKVEDLVVLKDSLPQILRDQYTINQLIPDYPNETKIVEFMHYLAELHSLDIEITDFTEAQPLPLAKLADDKKSDEEKKLDAKLVRTLRRFQATIRIGGKFNDVVSFVRDFKRSNRYFEIFAITIPEEETARALPDTYPISFDGYFYFYGEDEEKGGSEAEKTEFERLIEAEGLGEKYLEDGSSRDQSDENPNDNGEESVSLDDIAKESGAAGDGSNPEENTASEGDAAENSGNIKGASDSSSESGGRQVGAVSGSLRGGCIIASKSTGDVMILQLTNASPRTEVA